MRMWMIDPKLMCDKHLLGEHGEIHKHKHIFEKGNSVANRIKYPAQIVPALMEQRHDELSLEMAGRGFNHDSPYTLPDLRNYSYYEIYPRIDVEYNLADLVNRCPQCKLKIKGVKV